METALKSLRLLLKRNIYIYLMNLFIIYINSCWDIIVTVSLICEISALVEYKFSYKFYLYNPLEQDKYNFFKL